MHKGSFSPTSSLAFIICELFDGHSDLCKVIFTVVVNCISLIISDVEHFFHMISGHLYVFREMSI